MTIIWIHLQEVRGVVKLIETESQMVIPRDWREGENGELLFNGHRVSIWEDENNSGIRW